MHNIRAYCQKCWRVQCHCGRVSGEALTMEEYTRWHPEGGLEPTDEEKAEIEARYRVVCGEKVFEEVPEPQAELRYGRMAEQPISYGAVRQRRKSASY